LALAGCSSKVVDEATPPVIALGGLADGEHPNQTCQTGICTGDTPTTAYVSTTQVSLAANSPTPETFSLDAAGSSGGRGPAGASTAITVAAHTTVTLNGRPRRGSVPMTISNAGTLHPQGLPSNVSPVVTYHLEPSGAQFSPPLTFTMTFDPASIQEPGAHLCDDDLAHCEPLTGTLRSVVVNGVVQTQMTVPVAHFSTLVLSNPSGTLASHGSTGGGSNSLDCGSGNVAVGVYGRSGSYVDQIGLICAPLNNLGASFKTSNSYGGSGGGPFTQQCPPGEVLVGIFGRSGSVIDQIGIQCQYPLDWIASGAVDYGAYAGGGTGGGAFTDTCPQGSVINRLQVWSGAYVGGVQAQYVPMSCSGTCSPGPSVFDVTTHHNDNGRTAANLRETILTTSNVTPAQFGKNFSYPVVGSVYAQPLYLSGLNINGGTHDVVYVATTRNFVYALDADTYQDPLWGPVSLGPSVSLPDSNIGPAGYKDISWSVGVLSTPVISRARNAIYVVAFTKGQDASGHACGKNGYCYLLYRLDLTTGAIVQSVEISGAVSGSGDGGTKVVFTPNRQNQRPGLLLGTNGSLYIAFAAFGDQTPYHGWVFRYDADSLAQQGIYNTTPNGAQAGIWQAGQGLTADGSNNVYALTGNGDFNGTDAMGDAALKLAPDLHLADYFSPFDNVCLDNADQDLGSAGLLLLPGRNQVLGGGKQSRLYLINTNGMGKYCGATGQVDPCQQNGVDGYSTTNTCKSTQTYCSSDAVAQSFSAGDVMLTCSGTFDDTKTQHIHGSPAYWQTPNGPYIYVWPENAQLKAFKLDTTGQFETTAITETNLTVAQGMPGGFLSISANGSTSGTGILWASHPAVAVGLAADANQQVVDGELQAYDATSLGTPLWSSKQNPVRDDVGNFAKFCPPTVANGKVYMPAFGGVTGKVTLPDKALGSVALGSCDQTLALAWTGTDSAASLNVEYSNDARSFYGKVTLNEHSIDGPALAHDDVNERAFLAWTGTDPSHSLNVMPSTGANCTTFSGKTTLGEHSIAGPALAFGGGRLFLAWAGTDSSHSLNVAFSTDGSHFTKTTLSDTSDNQPSLFAANGKLYLAWTGGGNAMLNVMESTDAFTTNGMITFTNKITFNEQSHGQPTLVRAALPGVSALYLAWTGTDAARSLNLMTSIPAPATEPTTNQLGYKMTFGDTSSSGVALTTFKNNVYVAWPGNGNSFINIATMSLGKLTVYGSFPLPGSYQQTCIMNSCSVTATGLQCSSCRDVNGVYQSSNLVLPCDGDIANCNGQLKCGHC
jgi:hypothetical protein